jgi:type VI protein secretion system component VasF
VREATPGRYYHDLAGERARVRRRVPWLFALVIVLAIIAVASGWYNMHQVRPLP